jgi:hypothetical protein
VEADRERAVMGMASNVASRKASRDSEVSALTPGGCRRRGRAEADVSRQVADQADGPAAGKQKKESGSRGAGEKRSWLNIITSITQVTLDIIRVIREGTDLYRKIKLGT